MKSFYLMDNSVRHYAWGDSKLIPEFLQIPNPDGGPFAEVWMGDHPGAPSKITLSDGTQIPADQWISQNAESVLGPQTARRYGRMPFLFKLLAAGRSLSIQAHPSKETAEAGFAREEAAGIPRDAPHRNYRDANHKPEIIMALTPFTAMIGFRSVQDTAAALSVLPAAAPLVRILQTDGHKAFFHRLMTMEKVERQKILDSVPQAAQNQQNSWDRLQRKWTVQLASDFPGDPGALAPLFLHVLEIRPAQALYQPAGMLHAYLSGFGVELMANSDNVLRGGLTPKHIDVSELMKVLSFEPSEPSVLTAQPGRRPGIRTFETPAQEFSLSLTEPGDELILDKGPCIVLALDSQVILNSESDQLILKRGQSALIPNSAAQVKLSGPGTAALAREG